jgi:hypothetical protein
MTVPPPGLGSTTTDWPKTVLKCCATNLAAASTPPPAGYGTTMRNGLAGQSCAKLKKESAHKTKKQEN